MQLFSLGNKLIAMRAFTELFRFMAKEDLNGSVFNKVMKYY